MGDQDEGRTVPRKGPKKGRAHDFRKPEVETEPHTEFNYVLILAFILIIFVMAWLAVYLRPYYLMIEAALVVGIIVLLIILGWRGRRKAPITSGPPRRAPPGSPP
jgi:hypothetical protein